MYTAYMCVSIYVGKAIHVHNMKVFFKKEKSSKLCVLKISLPYNLGVNEAWDRNWKRGREETEREKEKIDGGGEETETKWMIY